MIDDNDITYGKKFSGKSTKEEVEQIFRNEDIYIPLLDKHTWSQLYHLKDLGFVWSTRDQTQDPYNLLPYIQELQITGVSPYVLFGIRGYGLNNWYYHLFLVENNFAVFLQLNLGYAKEHHTMKRIQGTIGIIDEFLRPKMELAAINGRIRTSQKMIIVQSDQFNLSEWVWQNAPGRSIPPENWNKSNNLWIDILNTLAIMIEGNKD